MADLIAQGPEATDRWRRRLNEGVPFELGRRGAAATPWDNAISKRHALLEWNGKKLHVERLQSARNAIFFKGNPANSFELDAGEHFVIGQTIFTLSSELIQVTLDSPAPQKQRTYSPEELKQAPLRSDDRRMAILTQLPDVIARADDDLQLMQSVANVLLAGVVAADAVGIVSADTSSCEAATSSDSRDTANSQQRSINVLHWDRRLVTGLPFEPSRGLVNQAVDSRKTVLHVWDGEEHPTPTDAPPMTLAYENSWALACPVESSADAPWCLYLMGQRKAVLSEAEANELEQLHEDAKFIELTASILGNLLKLRQLERDRSSLRSFFSPVVLEAIAGNDPEQVLAPRQTQVSVLFCDLRGFTRKSEERADDLMGLLDQVSTTLGVTTEAILSHGGVVGDFHGDATMGFWGWPVGDGREVEQACKAALAIRGYRRPGLSPDKSEAQNFQMGLGLATGEAVAGKIGTKDQVKVTVFGPVVNLASRLESMTRQLKASVLIDQSTARIVRDSLGPKVARVRTLAVVRPFGMNETVEVSELLPPVTDDEKLTDEHLLSYEQAWQCVVQGRWNEAYELLHKIPAEDRAKDFLTVYIAQHDRTPPADWAGFIPLGKK